jgi:hypothetical protein
MSVKSLAACAAAIAAWLAVKATRDAADAARLRRQLEGLGDGEKGGVVVARDVLPGLKAVEADAAAVREKAL